jgi:hypothetical protein
MDGPLHISFLGSIRSKQSVVAAMAAGLRGPKLELRCTICDEVSSYVIYTTRGTRFANSRWRKWSRESRQRWRSSIGAWRWWGRPLAVLQLWGAALQFCLALLKLLLGSIASEVDESSLCGGYLCALGFGACGAKFDEYGPLFIGLLGPTRRGDRVLHLLSINQTLIRLCLQDFWKGMNLEFVTIWKPNSRTG